MSKSAKRARICECLCCAALVFTAARTLIAAEPNADGQAARINLVTLEVYIRGDSARSQKAAQFTRQLGESRHGLKVVIHDVLADDVARRRFWDLCEKYQAKKPGLPAFFACNRVRFGFEDAKSSGRAVEELLTIRAFVREGCTHCQDAKRFLTALQKRWPAVRIELIDVIHDPSAQQQMLALAQQYGVQVSLMPAIEVCGRFVVGYDRDATTGRQIEDILRGASVPSSVVYRGPRQSNAPNSWNRDLVSDNRPRIRLVDRRADGPGDVAGSQPNSVPSLPPEAEEETTLIGPPSGAPEGIELPGWGMVRVNDLGLPAFTLIIGLVDGFNPCAMWVLVFLLSILVNVRNRVKMLAIAGTFVLVSGFAYFAFMAAWLNMFLLVGISRSLQIALGLTAILIGVINIKDFVAFKRGPSLSIPAAAKEGIYARVRKIVAAKYLSAAVAMAVVLAIGVNLVELLCTAGLPALYTQILTMQNLPALQNYMYLLLYNLAYMFDDAVMLSVFVITLSHRKVQEREGRYLKFISGFVILVLGLIMLFKPEWLELARLNLSGAAVSPEAI